MTSKLVQNCVKALEITLVWLDVASYDFPDVEDVWKYISVIFCINTHSLCQVCNKSSHTVVYCYHKYDPEFQGIHSSPTVMMEGSHIGSNNAWYLDSGTTDHLTADIANMSTHSKYHGHNQVQVRNGNVLPITHVGSSIMQTPFKSFRLTNWCVYLLYIELVICPPIQQR